MKIRIDNHNFNTDKAAINFRPAHWDGSNMHTADLYLSATGILYGNSLSQWGNMHGEFEILTPGEALEKYGNALDDEDKSAIAALGGLVWK